MTAAIKDKKYQEATRLKQELEERQREKAKEREESQKKFQPVFFTNVIEDDGRPNLSEEGKRALQLLQESRWELGEGESGEIGLKEGVEKQQAAAAEQAG